MHRPPVRYHRDQPWATETLLESRLRSPHSHTVEGCHKDHRNRQNPEEYVRKNLLREAQLMRRLRHPNIIRLYETMKTSNLYCLVMEVAEGGELLSHVRNDFKEKRLSEATTRPFIRQLVSALHHLHSAGIVHRTIEVDGDIMLDLEQDADSQDS
ncbi:Hormonally up-regulated neu tumor-associated kinase [Geodia barretti]|uniref:Hormonally up-regulated neu tumor-associated kinase n=1 Tax=Geodia barretti TaxID=519541 RepID=A0AA35QZV4_GEOBA|nr:Hormonally up-regulated neu tumor-associated kinase [Geodia barretti]